MYGLKRFLRNLKYDDLYIKEFETPKEMMKGIRKYIHTLKTNRPHVSLGASHSTLSSNANQPITQPEQGVRMKSKSVS